MIFFRVISFMNACCERMENTVQKVMGRGKQQQRGAGGIRILDTVSIIDSIDRECKVYKKETKKKQKMKLKQRIYLHRIIIISTRK